MQSWNIVLQLSELRIFVCVLSVFSNRHVIFLFLSLFVILTFCPTNDVIMGSFQAVVPIYQVLFLVYLWGKVNILKWIKQGSVNSHNNRKKIRWHVQFFFFGQVEKTSSPPFVSFPHYTVKQQVLQFSQMDAKSGRMPCLSLITWKSSEEFLASFRKKELLMDKAKMRSPTSYKRTFKRNSSKWNLMFCCLSHNPWQ